MSIRRASHAGSWYTDSGSELNNQLSDWLSKAALTHAPARAIIAPHAGYSYSGPCSAFAYKQMDPSRVKRVFILGPSHHVRLNGCALTRCETYETPLYNLTVDHTINKQLEATGSFEKMSLSTDEDEHSIEMHLPYIAKAMESRKDRFTVIPVMVGSINTEKEALYGRIFSKYLSDPENFFVISSDFCHWGQRFSYTHYEKEHGEIWQSIENLDRRGMALIEALNPRAFADYLKAHQNTICGRHPIGVFLNAVECLNTNGFKDKFTLKFVQYAQSNKCKSMRDSSVSYASASLVVLP